MVSAGRGTGVVFSIGRGPSFRTHLSSDDFCTGVSETLQKHSCLTGTAVQAMGVTIAMGMIITCCFASRSWTKEYNRLRYSSENHRTKGKSHVSWNTEHCLSHSSQPQGDDIPKLLAPKSNSLCFSFLAVCFKLIQIGTAKS